MIARRRPGMAAASYPCGVSKWTRVILRKTLRCEPCLIRYSNFEIWISSFFRNRRLLKARKDGILLDAMKNRIGVLILVVVCVGLGIGLIGVKRQADTEKAKDIVSIQSFSNN